MIVFTLGGYSELGDKIRAGIAAATGEIETKHFPDGERYLRIRTDVRDHDVVLVAGATGDSQTLDIFDLACGLVTAGCRSLKMIMPFFAYSTMERATREGEVVTAKTRARLFSAIPSAPFGNQVVLLDLHSEGIPFYFEGTIKTRHLYAKALITREARRLGGKNFILGAADAGRAKWVESLAKDLGVPAGFVYKKRESDGKISVSGSNIPVQNLPVILYDDMIRSGGSILQACEAYKQAGAATIDVLTSHGVFTSGAIAKMKSSGLVRELVCTDSHPNALAVKDSFLKVVSAAEVFIDFLKGGGHEN